MDDDKKDDIKVVANLPQKKLFEDKGLPITTSGTPMPKVKPPKNVDKDKNSK